MFIRTTIVVCALALSLSAFATKGDADPQKIEITLEQHIERIFENNSKVAMATLKAESGLKLDAKGWNCHYYNKQGKRYSDSCKKQDRHLAWSVDCGIAQVNVKGQNCPRELLTLEGNMKQVEKIYKTQGLDAWSAYKNGSYKRYL